MEEEIQFIDAESPYNAQQGGSFKEIVMTHLSRIGTLCTKEFRKGYWEKRPVKVGDTVHIIETYKEDTRDAYINAVDFLHDVLLPKFDKECEKEVNKINMIIEGEMNSHQDEETWKSNRLLYRRKIFQQLSLLLKRLRYLEQGSISD